MKRWSTQAPPAARTRELTPEVTEAHLEIARTVRNLAFGQFNSRQYQPGEDFNVEYLNKYSQDKYALVAAVHRECRGDDDSVTDLQSSDFPFDFISTDGIVFTFRVKPSPQKGSFLTP